MREKCQLVLFYVYVGELKGSNKWEMVFLFVTFVSKCTVCVLSTCVDFI